LDTPPALVLALALLALALVLAACGGGSTANPVAASTDATTATTATSPAAPPATTPTAAATAPSAARTTRTAPPAVPATPHDPAAPVDRPRPSGGASADSSTTTADEPAPQEAVRPTPTPTPARQPAESVLDERANLILTRRVSPSHYFQQGTVVGTHDGTMEVEARITSKGVLVSFTATLPGGTISGRGVAVAILDSTTWPSLRGRAIVTGGTGRFAGISGRRLKVIGRAKPDASRAHVRLVGTVSS